MRRITGYTEEEITGRSCQNHILDHIDREGREWCFFGCPLYAIIVDGHQRKDQVFLCHKDGHRFSAFNNAYGHDLDDKILIKVGKSISKNIRKTDLFGR